ncbi:hypothetical protein T1I15_13180 [Lactiplantibacillus plantarum]|nr:hypothetical protein T1I15_13180 [Lactiplantibacillus plantarum]
MTIAETQLAAEQASRAQDWSKAASLWEQVYQAQQTAPVNYELVQALVADQQYVAAANYASEFEAAVFSNRCGRRSVSECIGC